MSNPFVISPNPETTIVVINDPGSTTALLANHLLLVAAELHQD